MGSIAALSLSSGIFMLAGYLAYKWLLSTENQPGLNRALLLTLYLLALTLPLLPAMEFASNDSPVAAPAIIIEQIEARIVEAGPGPWWKSALLWLYTAGAASSLLFTSVSLLRLLWIIRGGRHIKAGGYTLILLSDSRLAPFSWLRYIVMNEQDYNESGPMIITHEQAHLRLGHWLDLLMADAVCALMWYNPASWLMRRELRNVHEYQADRAVLCAGADVRQYQMLLIKKAVGQRFPSLANSLNHSKLKKRITMMCTNSTRGARRLRALVLGPAMLAALAVVNIPSVASTLTDVSGMLLSVSSADNSGKVTKSSPIAQAASTAAAAQSVAVSEAEPACGQMPQFPGGEQALFRFLGNEVRYPADAIEAGQEGRVVVQFTIEASGKISNPKVVRSVCESLDREALRVVSKMPDWTPGYSKGKPVDCSYVIPVDFKLRPSEKAAATNTIELNGEKLYVADDAVVTGYSGKTSDSGTEPTILVDGKEWKASIDDISPNTIESITVLKNKPEYPNGLIMITLKK